MIKYESHFTNIVKYAYLKQIFFHTDFIGCLISIGSNILPILYKYCRIIVQILCKYCSNIVYYALCKCWANIEQILLGSLYEYCFKFCKYNANIVQIFANIMQILCKYVANISQILYKYHTNIIWINYGNTRAYKTKQTKS